VRSRLRGLFAPTDTGDAVAELIASHGRELELRSEKLLTAVHDLERREARARELHARVEEILREGSAELDTRQSELNTRAAELDSREAALAVSEERVEERSRALGAVELRRAAVERREESLRARATELERRAAELTALSTRVGESKAPDVAGAPLPTAHVALVVAGSYRLLEREGPAPAPGELVELEDGAYRCLRLTSSPFPADARRCALLEPLPATEPGSEGAGPASTHADGSGSGTNGA
jgi:DNA repair exonuclease SbcCD ATPase subunit